MTLKKHLIYLFVLLNTHLLFAQSVSFGWAKQFESNRTYGSGVSIAIDSKKNVYSVGLFTGTADMDPGTGVFNLTTTSNTALFISKLDSSGNFLWAKQFTGSLETIPYSIDIDLEDNIYFTGTFSGITDFDPNVGVFNLTAASLDVFICKLNSSGNFLFAKSFFGTANLCCGYSRSIVVDKDKNIYTTGSFNGVVDFDPNASSYSLSSNSADIFVSKLDSLGNFVWAKQMGGMYIDHSFSIEIDKSDNILTTGRFKGTADFDPGSSTYFLTSADDQDVFVSKLDKNGNFIWAKSFSGGGFNDIGNSIAVDSIGNIFTTGVFFGTVDFDPGVGVFNVTVNGSDMFISKLDSNGNFVWVKNMGTNGNITGTSICTDRFGNVYTTGYYNNGGDFDPGSSVFILTGSNLTTTFISKLNNNGDFVFAKSFWNYNNSYSQIYGTEIKIDPQDNLYISGYYKGTPDFDPNAGVYNITSPNFQNSYVVKLNPCTLPNAPTITIPTNDMTLCSGNSATLTATGSGTIKWYDLPSIINPIYIGSPIVINQPYGPLFTIYAQAYTCDASAVMTPVTLTINPSPTITVNNGAICAGESYTIIPNGANSYTYSSGSAVVNPTSSTIYTVTGANLNGCVSNTTCSIYIKPSPTITVNSGSVCAGQSFTMYPSGADYYSYSSGNAIVTPTSSTNYSVTGTIWGGCQSVNAAISSVTVNPTPTVIAISSDSLLCIGSTATLTASGATNYIWNNIVTSSSINVNPFINTTYTVTGTNSFGCSSSYLITQNVTSCVGVIEIYGNNNISIYPNPISNQLKIDIYTDLDNLKLELYNAIGELILSTVIHKDQNIIDVSFLNSGLYFAKITSENKNIFVQKIIK